MLIIIVRKYKIYEIPGNIKNHSSRWMEIQKSKRFTLPIHTSKPGKVTIPKHPGDIAPQTIKQILKQAGM